MNRGDMEALVCSTSLRRYRSGERCGEQVAVVGLKLGERLRTVLAAPGVEGLKPGLHVECVMPTRLGELAQLTPVLR